MNADTEHKKALARAENLFQERKKILTLPSEKALDHILKARHPAALVHSFPEEDFYFLVQDIGPQDSISLLALASSKQVEFILDIEVWEKDRIALQAASKWLDLIFRADSNRFIKWFLDQKTDLNDFFLNKNIEVKIREYDQDPSIFGEDFFTFDDTYYIRILNVSPEITGLALRMVVSIS